MEQLLNRTDLLEFPVIFFQNGFILVIKPVSFAAAYRLHGLCIQLAVVYRHVRINGGSHFHAYKTAAATAVRQQVFVVARPDERSVAPYLLNAASVGLAQVGNGFLQKVFQKALLMDAHLVELVDIHQQKAPQVHFRIAFAAEIQTVGIAEAEFGRKDYTAEGGLAVTLCTYQQR